MQIKIQIYKSKIHKKLNQRSKMEKKTQKINREEKTQHTHPLLKNLFISIYMEKEIQNNYTIL